MSDVRAMAARSLACGGDSIDVVKISEPTSESVLYEAQGCGQRRRYICEGTNALVRRSGRALGHEQTVCRGVTPNDDGSEPR